MSPVRPLTRMTLALTLGLPLACESASDTDTPADASAATGGTLADAAVEPDVGSTRPDAASAMPDAESAAPDPRADTLIAEAAEAICGALLRCCDASDLITYFRAYGANERLSDFVGRLPPEAEIDAATCPALVGEMLAVVPLGSWVDAVVQGRARIVAERVDACLRVLDEAACGAPTLSALFDSTCFWLNPPVGGDEQRTIFARDQQSGDTCQGISDGFGGLFYGTCNPHTDYCCFGTADDCGFPDGADALGTCAPAGDLGAACSQVPVRLCRTGLDCGDDNLCHAPADAPLGIGDPCVDASFNLLGLCMDAYCDFFESRTCLPRKADGEACGGPEECVGLSCVEGVCGPTFLCNGL